jgi:hypothetical protein
MRERPWFQSIGSGRAGDHITTLGLVREAEIWNALRRAIPNVTGVHVPLSGTSSFSAYVSIEQSRPGEAKHVIPIVLGVDHYLKLVVVVDDDIECRRVRRAVGGGDAGASTATWSTSPSLGRGSTRARMSADHRRSASTRRGCWPAFGEKFPHGAREAGGRGSGGPPGA